MSDLITSHIPYEQVDNGALILLLLRECKTWDDLCGRYAFADPNDLRNTTTMAIRDKLLQMRKLGLLSFKDEDDTYGKKPLGVIEDTGLWSEIRVALGGMSLSDAARLSRHSAGMAVTPVFGRHKAQGTKPDVFVLMPYNAELQSVYTQHIKPMGKQLGVNIQRADDIFAPGPFMEKVWDGICAARLVIADCTQQNPNVFYEIGIAHTVGKKVVLITRSENDIPSDIGHYEYIRYAYDPEGTAQLVAKLKLFIESFLQLPTPEVKATSPSVSDAATHALIGKWRQIGSDKTHSFTAAGVVQYDENGKNFQQTEYTLGGGLVQWTIEWTAGSSSAFSGTVTAPGEMSVQVKNTWEQVPVTIQLRRLL